MVISDNAAETFPETFRADDFYRWGTGVFTGIGVLGITLLLVTHQTIMLPILGALTIAFFLLFLTTLSLKIQMDDEGLSRTWLWGRKALTWKQIARMEKTRRSLFLLDEKGKDLIPTSPLSATAKDAIAKKAIARARLRPSKEKSKSAALEIWTRK